MLCRCGKASDVHKNLIKLDQLMITYHKNVVDKIK
jgi:hypothetical protein